jgi:cell wall-associated NlpC family hydrolase
MRRGLIAAALALLLTAPATAEAASWAQPQIRVVVNRGLMGPSVEDFHPRRALTRGALAEAVARLIGEPQPVVHPDQPVLMRTLDRRLVRAAGLGGAASRFQRKLRAAGLRPATRVGTEIVARFLGLRFNHPATKDFRERRPQDVATRAEAAYSLARLVAASDATKHDVSGLSRSLDLPAFTDWQRRVLRRAVSFVGYPYVWGGTSERRQTVFGITSRGGFDCSGFVWRVYKLQPYAGAPQLSDVLVGRTTYEMSGEVPRSERIRRRGLRPADVVFFGTSGPDSRPAEVGHAGIYVGHGWFVHSSGNGTTLTTLTDWYADTFAWGRRPLREAGLS